MDDWSRDAVIKRMKEISNEGFIEIPEGMYRKDDGAVGQILEREFHVEENNLHVADLGTFDLKGARKHSSKITMFHQTTAAGMSPNEIFDHYSYEKWSNKDGKLKRKLFTTVTGRKFNNLGFILKVNSENNICLYNRNDFLCSWELSNDDGKINQLLLGLAETQGALRSKEEKFHYTDAYLLYDPMDLRDAVKKGLIMIDFCIDQPAEDFRKKVPHDRGPHFRATKKNLFKIYTRSEKIL